MPILSRPKATGSTPSTQAYLDIAAIKNDTLILSSGGLRAIILVSSVNFALKSETEQEDIVLRYQAFLNALAFPIQILMQSRRLDLTNYLEQLNSRAQSEPSPAIRNQIVNYVDYINKILSVVNIMDKRFYVIVPYDPVGLKQRSFFDRLLHPTRQVTLSMTQDEFGQFASQLDERVALIENGLASLGLRTGRLSTKRIIELLYATYNPEEATTERLVDIEELTSRAIKIEEQSKEREE